MLTRRLFLKFVTISLSVVTINSLYALENKPLSNLKKTYDFKISLNGDLDDDLIIIKATPSNIEMTDLYQMHNPSPTFEYNKRLYPVVLNPGYLEFSKEYKFENDSEIYLVMLANEREEAHLTSRIRTHYKSEKVMINQNVFIPSFMPEYNSVPNYPLWYGEGDTPAVEREDINGKQYNYYNLFDNTVVPLGIVFKNSGIATIKLFDQNDELCFTYKQEITQEIKHLSSNELKDKKISNHPFIEIGNILNEDVDDQVPNDMMITNIIIEYNGMVYKIPTPYPMMYPNLIYATAIYDNKKTVLVKGKK